MFHCMIPPHQHRDHLPWSGRRVNTWLGHGDTHITGPWPGYSSVPSPPISGGSYGTSTTSNSLPSWHTLATFLDQQNNHNYQEIDPPGTPYWHVDASPSSTPPVVPPNTSSGGERSVPYFQKLLSKLEVRCSKIYVGPSQCPKTAKPY